MTEKFKNDEYPTDIEDRPILYSEDIAQVCYKRLCIIAEHDRKLYGKGVQEHWSKIEDALLEEFPKVLKKASQMAENSIDEAVDYINEWSINLQRETIEEAKSVFDQLI